MLRAETLDRVTWLTFERPERLNSFTAADYGDLRAALDRCGSDDNTRVVVVTGSGRAFSAGADRSLLDGSASDGGAEAGRQFFGLVDALASFPKPLIAAVNGLAVGFGCTMLLYADVVLMARSARLRLPFTSLGITPEAGSSALLPRQVRWPDAVWATLSSEWIDADDAVRAGFAWRAVADDDLVDETRAAARAIAAHDPAAVAATKKLMTEGRAETVKAAVERELDATRRLQSR